MILGGVGFWLFTFLNSTVLSVRIGIDGTLPFFWSSILTIMGLVAGCIIMFACFLAAGVIAVVSKIFPSIPDRICMSLACFCAVVVWGGGFAITEYSFLSTPAKVYTEHTLTTGDRIVRSYATPFGLHKTVEMGTTHSGTTDWLFMLQTIQFTLLASPLVIVLGFWLENKRWMRR